MLTLLFACGPGAVAPDDAGAPDEDAAGCVADDGAFLDLDVALTDVPTVARVTWRSASPGRGKVRATTDGEADVETTPEPDDTTSHAVLVRGLLEARDYTFVVEQDGACADARTIATGSFDARVPDFSLVAYEADRVGDAWFPVIVAKGAEYTPTVLDGQGRPVWARPQEGGLLFRAVLSLDGEAVLVNAQARSVDDPGAIQRIGWDGVEESRVEVPGLHTDFVELPDGGYAALGWDLRTFGDRKLLGDTIVEIDPDGSYRTIWSSFDVVPVDLSVTYEQEFYVADPEVEDWTHANGLHYDEAHDAYLVTINLVEAVARVRRGTGETDWMLGDYVGDFTNTGEGRLVQQPHSARALPQGLLVFNRGVEGESCSEAVEIGIDEERGLAERAWSWSTEDCLHVNFLGEALRAPDGNTTIIWSDRGRIDTIAPDGERVRGVELPADTTFRYGGRADSLY